LPGIAGISGLEPHLKIGALFLPIVIS